MKNLQTIKQSVQKGFTLIELMIVVAIIGILAALAIPAYSDYTIKAKVSEAASLTGAMKAAVEIYYSENGVLPDLTDNSTYADDNAWYDGLGVSSQFTGKYASSVLLTSATPAAIDITIHGFPASSTGLNGETVTYTPTVPGGNVVWEVTGTIETKYLPKT
ncbi:MAG: hypothetical protein A6F70_00565 [Cycloclasticus sp. symbiont of Bathymodiolus heckerae]|nr:MAG: hypothetical protein A6F70_00565 [Cycloclasticus sp. symbiont of Bathymodiolus heckerae]